MTARDRQNLIQKVFISFGYSNDRTRQKIFDTNFSLQKIYNIKNQISKITKNIKFSKIKKYKFFKH